MARGGRHVRHRRRRSGADVAAERAACAEFDAVVLATGVDRARATCAVPGRELGGIHLAMSFLRGNTRRLLDGGADGRGADRRGGQGRRRHRRRRHRHRLRRHGDPPGRAERRASWRSCRGRRTTRAADNPWPRVAEGLQARLRAGGGRGAVGRGPAPLRRPRRAGSSARDEQRDRRRDRRTSRGRAGPDGRSDDARGRRAPTQVLPADLVLLALGFTGPGARAARGVRLRAGPARQRPRRTRTGMTTRPGRLRGRRLLARPVARGLGDPRGEARCQRRGGAPVRRRASGGAHHVVLRPASSVGGASPGPPHQAGAICRSSHSPGSSRGRISSARPPRTATSAGIGCDRKSGIDSVNP